jgi:hypothetical protein
MPKPKEIGTTAERYVLNYLQANFWPGAERIVLHGSADQGDIGHCGDFIFEVKAGAQTAQEGNVAGWLAETRAEARHRGVKYGVLVTSRRGYGEKRVERWWAHMDATVFADIVTDRGMIISDPPAVRMELGDFLYWAVAHGAI